MDDGIKVAYIVGAGTMGHGFAQYLAMNGLNVLLMDTSEDLLKKAQGVDRRQHGVHGRDR